ncbi:hypothetical protein [Streptomyces sp. MK5]|uniref:hypothetical protein n=1 Tax=Streptomyces sp. MK5 TaxID=3064253 RepID=UPI0027409215|nr:hypothetical protein [Streptomyces sp. MK5]
MLIAAQQVLGRVAGQQHRTPSGLMHTDLLSTFLTARQAHGQTCDVHPPDLTIAQAAHRDELTGPVHVPLASEAPDDHWSERLKMRVWFERLLAQR